jgi:glycolate oxidase iron-sulfur subunit
VSSSPRPSSSADPARLLVEADRCVKCGLCLPHCPTFRLAAVESESPRGRIALIQGLLEGGLPRSEGLEHHLDRCLGCRACEAACPSGVRYGELIDMARAHLSRPRSPWRRALLALLSRPRAVGPLVRAARALGLRRLAGIAPVPLRHWLELLPDAQPPLPTAPQTAAASAGRVGLFLGCVARDLEPGVARAASSLLTRLGYEVVEPPGQGCCGAMHLHAGLLAEAAQRAAANVQAFAGGRIDAIVSTATGCGAVLRDYGRHPALPAALPTAAVDLVGFLAGIDWPAALPLRPLPRRVAMHLPCSARQAGVGLADVERLLSRIPKVRLSAIDPAVGCCGAAGAYVLYHTATADALRSATLDAILGADAEIVVSLNVGCAMHLRAGLAEAGVDIPVLHPVELLEAQCGEPGSAAPD